MIFARNKLVIANSYSGAGRFEFLEPIRRVTISAYDALRVQVSEFTPAVFTNPEDTEVELDIGTHGLSFPQGIYGIQFRAVAGNATFSIRAYSDSEGSDTYTTEVADVGTLDLSIDELKDVVAKDVTVAPLPGHLIGLDNRLIIVDGHITPLHPDLVGVDLNIVETRNVVAKDASIAPLAKDVTVAPLPGHLIGLDNRLIGVDTRVVELRTDVAKDVNITPLAKDATNAKDANITGLRGLVGELPTNGLRGQIGGVDNRLIGVDTRVVELRTDVAKDVNITPLAKDSTVAKDATAAKEVTLGTVAKESTVAKDATVSPLNGNITGMRSLIGETGSAGLRGEVAKEATLGTVTKDATAAKEATLGTVAKESTVAKDATVSPLNGNITGMRGLIGETGSAGLRGEVAKEATLGTVTKDATAAKEATLGTVAKEATVAKDSTIAKDASLATQNALITTLNALVTQLTDLNKSGGTVVTKWAYSGGVTNGNADAVVIRSNSAKRLYIVGMYASYSTAAPRGPMTLGVGIDGVTYSIEAQFEMPDGAREIRFHPPLNLGGIAVDYMRLRVAPGGAGIVGRCLLHCVEM